MIDIAFVGCTGFLYLDQKTDSPETAFARDLMVLTIDDIVEAGFGPAETTLFGNESPSVKRFDVVIEGVTVPVVEAEFWTSKQRQASSIHEISYRACFKPQLPRFFIESLTVEADTIYDPFSGRGTTAIEAALLGRKIVANDINPLSRILTEPRLRLPSIEALERRLNQIEFESNKKAEIDLSMFFHEKTLSEIISLRNYLAEQKRDEKEDHLDQWIRMVATNRLTGHSKGFFSVYTLPPNQAVSPSKQLDINKKLNQLPEYRDVKSIILRKTRQLLRNVFAQQSNNLKRFSSNAQFVNKDARETKEIISDSVSLTVTSPPFLDIVSYHDDNWMRCWFNDIDDSEFGKTITMSRTIDQWRSVMQGVFNELFRVTKTKGWVAFEVGEVRKGKIKLEEHVVPLGLAAGFLCAGILINSQQFTKTSNIWGVSNNLGGTNSNRIVLFQKPEKAK